MGYQQYGNPNGYRGSFRNNGNGNCGGNQAFSGNNYSRYASGNRMNANSLPLTMAYVPFQQWGDLYELDKALCQGTIFAELDKPFSERSCCNR